MVSGVSCAGLTIIVQPAASAGPILRVPMFCRRSACDALHREAPVGLAVLRIFGDQLVAQFLARRKTASRASAFFFSSPESSAMTRRMTAARSLRSPVQRLSLSSSRSRRRL